MIDIKEAIKGTKLWFYRDKANKVVYGIVDYCYRNKYFSDEYLIQVTGNSNDLDSFVGTQILNIRHFYNTKEECELEHNNKSNETYETYKGWIKDVNSLFNFPLKRDLSPESNFSSKYEYVKAYETRAKEFGFNIKIDWFDYYINDLINNLRDFPNYKKLPRHFIGSPLKDAQYWEQKNVWNIYKDKNSYSFYYINNEGGITFNNSKDIKDLILQAYCILRDINNSFAVPKPKTAELFKDAHADIKAYKTLRQ